MKEMNRKVGVVLSGVALALGILAVPVLAGTDLKTETPANAAPGNVMSQNIRIVTDTAENPSTSEIQVTPEAPVTPETPVNPATPKNPNSQFGCNSISAEAMQNVYNSAIMQDAMNSGDINKMRDAMNSPEIKAQLGDDVVNSMNQMMSDVNIEAMHGTQGSNIMGSGSRNMMNWQ